MDNHPALSVVVNETIAAVLPRLEQAVVAFDWVAVTNLVVRLLQGAGQPVAPEDALLASLEMKTEGEVDEKEEVKTKSEVDVKALEVARVTVVRYHEGVEAAKMLGVGGNTFTEYVLEVESSTGVKWLVHRRYTHFK